MGLKARLSNIYLFAVLSADSLERENALSLDWCGRKVKLDPLDQKTEFISLLVDVCVGLIFK